MPVKIRKITYSQETMKMFAQMRAGNWEPVFPTADIILIMKRIDFISFHIRPVSELIHLRPNPVKGLSGPLCGFWV